MVNPVLSLAEVKDFDIISGASLSAATNLGGRIPVGVYMPSGWTAADVSFEVSADGVTFVPVTLDDGTEYALTAAASKYIVIDPSYFYGAVHLKVRSGTSDVPVNQGADRTLQVALGRPDVR